MNQVEEIDPDELRPEYTEADFEGAVRGKYAGQYSGRPAKVVIECDRDADGRWLARMPGLPSVNAVADSREDAIRAVNALARDAIAVRLGSDWSPPGGLEFVVLETGTSRLHQNGSE